MKQCQMHISPAPECLVPCSEEATETVWLGEGMAMNLCKKHYNSINKYNTTKNNKKTIIDIDGLN